MLNVPLVLKPTCENPKAGNTTYRIANAKSIPKKYFRARAQIHPYSGAPGVRFLYYGAPGVPKVATFEPELREQGGPNCKTAFLRGDPLGIRVGGAV